MINVTTELMKNYKQTELMSPEKKFEALQTNEGCSLLFSIGTDNIFYVTEETVGHDTGWEKTNLSSAQIQNSFSGQSGFVCKTFEVGQSVVDGTIGIAMVLSDGTNDHLFLSLGNSNSDTSWIKSIKWIQYPFDNPEKNINIANVFLTETKNNTQFIVVDILRDPSSADKLISRYYIDTKMSDGHAWQPHDVSIDLQVDGYSSCLGRQYLPNSPHQPRIDGLYTFGKINGSAQFIFQPLYNEFSKNPIPALPSRLNLPNNLIADSIASCRKPDLSTDLYVFSNGQLFYFASSNQTDGCTAVLLSSNGMYNGVKKMYAHQVNNNIVICGLNGNNDVFYTTCPVSQELSPSAWSFPLPIITNVDLFSPYINKLDSGNTIFAVGENILQKLIKSTVDSTWQSQRITLPSLDINDTQKYSSFTTRIQVTDENHQPVPSAQVTICTNSRTSFYINHLYYIVDSKGIQINTDLMGCITIIEWINGLSGTKLDISQSNGIVTTISPMDKPFQKLAQLDSVDKLKNATITDTNGQTKSLINSNVSQVDLDAVVQSNVKLGKVYNNLSSATTPVCAVKISNQLNKIKLSNAQGVDIILADAGDLFRWLESGVDAVIEIIEDDFNDVCNFIAKIAGKVYSCVLDSVEKVVNAAVWVYNVVKTGIEDVIKFLEYLFEWDDILTTHKVMKNTFIQFSQYSINSLDNYKKDIASTFKFLQENIDKWADIPDFDQTPGNTTANNQAPSGLNSAPAQLGVHHYQGNAASADSALNPSSITEDIFKDLLELLKSEETTLEGAYNAIKTDIIDEFSTLSVTQIIKKFVAIVGDSLLQTTENILIAVIDVLKALSTGMIECMTTVVKIPVISWLYKEISGEELSFLDLFCLIAAIPATIVYKIGEGSAPYKKGDSFTEGLINANSLEAIQKLYSTSSVVNSPNDARLMTLAATEPVLDESRLKIFGIVSGVCACVGSIVLVVTSGLEQLQIMAGKAGPLETPIQKKFLNISSFCSFLGNILYLSPNIATMINLETCNWYQNTNSILTGISIIKGFVNFVITAVEKPALSFVSSMIETTMNFVWVFPTIMNVSENSSRWNTDYKSLIPETVGNLAANFAGIMQILIAGEDDAFLAAEDPATITAATATLATTLAIQDGLMLINGICMPVAGGIYEWAPNQKHS